MTAIRSAVAALRNFTRGFLGLATPPPTNPAAARLHLEDAAKRRPHCC